MDEALTYLDTAAWVIPNLGEVIRGHRGDQWDLPRKAHWREVSLRDQLVTERTIGANAIAASPTTKNTNIKPN